MSENKKVVVYRSGSGFTKNYATWLAQELKCELRHGKDTKVKDLLPYDTIIYGGSLYATGINGLKLITKNYQKLKDKKLIVFAVGASPVKEGITEYVRKANIPAELYDKFKFFYLRGGFNYNKLSPFLKLLMKLKKLQIQLTKNLDADGKGFLASFYHPVDFTNIKYIKPILESVEE